MTNKNKADLIFLSLSAVLIGVLVSMGAGWKWYRAGVQAEIYHLLDSWRDSAAPRRWGVNATSAGQADRVATPGVPLAQL